MICDKTCVYIKYDNTIGDNVNSVASSLRWDVALSGWLVAVVIAIIGGVIFKKWSEARELANNSILHNRTIRNDVFRDIITVFTNIEQCFLTADYKFETIESLLSTIRVKLNLLLLFTGESNIHTRCNNFYCNYILTLYKYWVESSKECIQLTTDINNAQLALNNNDLSKYIITQSDIESHNHVLDNYKINKFIEKFNENKQYISTITNKSKELTELKLKYMDNVRNSDQYKSYVCNLKTLILELYNELKRYESNT